MKTYNVILHKGVDYQSFWDDMENENDAGKLYIPNRRVESPNQRPGSERQTWYSLSEEEADLVRQDNRVLAVEIPPEFRDDIKIGLNRKQISNFTKTTSDSGDFVNWGLYRCNAFTNPYLLLSEPLGSPIYNYCLDGEGVDVVIQDSGIQVDHPEFEDINGVSRVQQIDWYTVSGLAGTQSPNHYRDFDGHGTHCAGIAAGKTYGWAKGARIYAQKLAGLEGTGDSGTGISITDAFDAIKLWHQNKPITETGYRRPTVVNMSWGYGAPYNTVTSLTYLDTSYTDANTTGNATYREQNYGLMNSSGAPSATYATNVRIPSVDVDIEEMIDVGIIICIAAGNRGHKIDIIDGGDYENFVVTNNGTIYYHRGSSPFSENCLIVGNVDSVSNNSTQDQKAINSECGPGVNIYAPGTDIMSCTSNTNKFADAPYYLDSNFRQCNISGTSMASPQVAGFCALLLQANPWMTSTDVLNYIINSSSSDLYTSGEVDDWTNRRSLFGGQNRFLYNRYAVDTSFSIRGNFTNFPLLKIR